MNERSKQDLTSDIIREISLPKAIGVILLISLSAFLFLIWLIYFKETGEAAGDWVSQLPALNALLNGTSTCFIILGYVAVRQKRYARHMKMMLTAFVTSSFFLISYLIYHNFAGSTPFPGQGLIRPVYFTILVSHIILSAFVLPLVLTSFYFAWAGKFARHRKLSRWTLPVWLYVSVTGVVIFVILNSYL